MSVFQNAPGNKCDTFVPLYFFSANAYLSSPLLKSKNTKRGLSKEFLHSFLTKVF